jgi:hypothetical protein
MRKLVVVSLFVFVFTCTSWGLPVNCSTLTTFSALVASNNNAEPGCIDQDKLYTNWGGTLPGTTQADIDTVEAGGTDFHSVQMIDIGPGSYTLSYRVSVWTGTGVITQVQVAADINPPTASVSKDVFVSGGAFVGNAFTNSGVIATLPITPGQTSLDISESINVAGFLQSTTDTYVQEGVTIPEPGAYLLLGGGLIALAVLRRRKMA